MLSSQSSQRGPTISNEALVERAIKCVKLKESLVNMVKKQDFHEQEIRAREE